jgi:hypothetical protein
MSTRQALEMQFPIRTEWVNRCSQKCCSWGKKRLTDESIKGSPAPLYINKYRTSYRVFFIVNFISSIVFIFFFIGVFLYNSAIKKESIEFLI